MRISKAAADETPAPAKKARATRKAKAAAEDAEEALEAVQAEAEMELTAGDESPTDADFVDVADVAGDEEEEEAGTDA